MIISSSGIVLSTLRYSDSSVIARIYTEADGLKSFMVRIGKGKAAHQKAALMQPLSLVQVAYRSDSNKSLHTLRTVERQTALRSIPFEPLKTCISLFIAEVISVAIKEEEQNKGLFNFLNTSVQLLDDMQESPVNFHLKFMLEFSRFLGFYPDVDSAHNGYFDLSEGTFVPTEPVHPYFMDKAVSTKLLQLLQTGMTAQHAVSIQNVERRTMLTKLIDFYRIHLDGMREIHSHKVLEEVLA